MCFPSYNKGSEKMLSLRTSPQTGVAIRFSPKARSVDVWWGADCHTSDIGHWFAMTANLLHAGKAERDGLSMTAFYTIWCLCFQSEWSRKRVEPSRIPTAMIPAMAAVCIPSRANSSICPSTA